MQLLDRIAVSTKMQKGEFVNTPKNLQYMSLYARLVYVCLDGMQGRHLRGAGGGRRPPKEKEKRKKERKKRKKRKKEKKKKKKKGRKKEGNYE